MTQELAVDLCRVWDRKGLLRLYPFEVGPKDVLGCTKVFNNFKSSTADRQIGDRRSQNFQEGKLPGPSKGLPSGRELLQLRPKRYEEKVIGCVADRRDFYHQFWVTDERASTNAIFPFLPAKSVCQLNAYSRMVEAFGRRKGGNREAFGDNLHGKPRPILFDPEATVVACFGAIFQGDHLGVEFATQSHSMLLARHGLLVPGSQFLADAPVTDDRVVTGLVIDDFFCLSREPVDAVEVEEFSACQKFKEAKEVYKREGILGSDDKDVYGQSRFRVIGAEVIADADTVKSGAVVVSAPFEKRLGLGLCSLLSAELPFTSDALHSMLVGSWISVLAFRRPLMAVANEVFKVIPAKELNTERPRLRSLPRAAASELQILAVLSPVIASNVSLPFERKLYATDASDAMGGIAVAEVGEEAVEALWVTADKKGSNIPMLSRAMAAVSQHDEFFEDEERPFEEEDAEEEVPRPIGLVFQFLEICGGAGKVTAKLCELGVNCGPVLDLSLSPHYNLADHRVISWVAFMLEQDRLESFLVSPPCTTFSPAAHPSLRTYKLPRGKDPQHPRVLLGNILAFAALTLLFVALRLEKFGMGEQPRRPARDHTHIPIQGAYTKPSAVYTDELAVFLAHFFAAHLQAKQKACDRLDLPAEGLESIITNDFASSCSWSPLAAWKWQFSCHINILESHATLKLFRIVAKAGGDIRFCYLGDSHVARSVIARGRSSSHALKPVLLKIAALCVGFGLYPAGRFCPTRLNPGDAPSRQAEIPPPVKERLLRIYGDAIAQGIYVLDELPKMRRWNSNWVRLTLLLNHAVATSLLFRSSWRVHPLLHVANHEWTLDFDSTLGFPGEGPRFLSWIFLLSNLFCPQLSVSVGTGASHGDLQRKAARAGIVLGEEG
eukprot:s620_g20.t1